MTHRRPPWLPGLQGESLDSRTEPSGALGLKPRTLGEGSSWDSRAGASSPT